MSTVLDYIYVGLQKLSSTIWLRKYSRHVVLVSRKRRHVCSSAWSPPFISYSGGPLYELMTKRVEQMKDMKYSQERDGDILEDRRDKVLEQQTQWEEIISID